jgi:hypothetical protein
MNINVSGDNFYKVYDRFDKLPEHCKNEFGASRWFKALATDGTDPAFACDCFQQIPLNLMTDELRKFAVYEFVRVLSLIDPGDTPAYKSICLIAYRSSYKAAQFFKAEVHTAEVVELMIRDYNGSFLNAYRSFPWIAELMTPALIETACLNSVTFMLSLPDDQMSQTALNKHLGEGPSTYSELKRAGKLRIGVDFLKSGRWPESDGPFDDDVQKPESLLEAFSLLLGGGDIPRALYMAYVMTYDIEDVMAMVVTPSCAKLVVEMYEEKELRPHIRSNRHLKAAMLETSLGL